MNRLSRDLASRAQRTGWSDRRIERWIGRLLRVGVLAAAVVVTVGGSALLFRDSGTRVDFGTFRLESASLLTIGGILRAVGALDSRAIVQLGVVLLIATPVARVALTLVAFLAQRDRLYVGITALVLGLLVYGLVWGSA